MTKTASPPTVSAGLLSLGAATDASIATAAERLAYAVVSAPGLFDQAMPLFGGGRRTPYGLAYGRAGAAIFVAVVAALTSNEELAQAALDFVDVLDLRHRTERLAIGVFNGVTGVAWAARTVCHYLNVGGVAEALAAIDDALIDELANTPSADHDHAHGAAGVAAYLLNEVVHERPASLPVIRRWLLRSSQQALQPQLPNSPSAGRASPFTRYPIGAAHGVCGLLAVARRLYEVTDQAGDREVLSRLRDYLAEAFDRRMADLFSSQERDKPPLPKPGWCWGDPAIMLELARADRVLDQGAASSRLNRICYMLTKRPDLFGDIRDASVCHGTAGVAHVCRRLFEDTGIEAFAILADYWLRRTVDAGHGAAVLAYRFPFESEAGELTWSVAPGLLIGTTGTVLVLLSILFERDPHWDAFLNLRPNRPAGGALRVGGPHECEQTST